MKVLLVLECFSLKLQSTVQHFQRAFTDLNGLRHIIGFPALNFLYIISFWNAVERGFIK